MADLSNGFEWQSHPDTILSDACANGACEKCPGGWSGHPVACGHPCHHDWECPPKVPGQVGKVLRCPRCGNSNRTALGWAVPCVKPEANP